jgi:hypothetical protein
MTLADGIGYCAAFLVFLTFSMRTIVPLRILGIASNVFFIAYGYLNPAYPVLVLHLALLLLNVFRLYQILNLIKQIGAAARGDLNMNWLKPFTTPRSVSTGDVLFRKGDNADALYYLISGRFRLAELGIELPRGEVVGELGFLAPDKTRTQTVECLEDGKVLKITYDQVSQIYFQNPKFGFYFLQLSSRRLFDNVQRLERIVLDRDAEIARLRSSSAG